MYLICALFFAVVVVVVAVTFCYCKSVGLNTGHLYDILVNSSYFEWTYENKVYCKRSKEFHILSLNLENDR